MYCIDNCVCACLNIFFLSKIIITKASTIMSSGTKVGYDQGYDFFVLCESELAYFFVFFPLVIHFFFSPTKGCVKDFSPPVRDGAHVCHESGGDGF